MAILMYTIMTTGMLSKQCFTILLLFLVIIITTQFRMRNCRKSVIQIYWDQGVLEQVKCSDNWTPYNTVL